MSGRDKSVCEHQQQQHRHCHCCCRCCCCGCYLQEELRHNETHRLCELSQEHDEQTHQRQLKKK